MLIRPVLLVTVGACCLHVALARAQTAPTAKPATPQTAPRVARISDALLADLLALAKRRFAQTLAGLWQSKGESQTLSLSSNRQLIAFMNAKAAEGGGRYTPPASMRSDTVEINCGDEDLGETFDCNRFVVKVGGRTIRTISYAAGPKSFTNALGARWTVNKVTATYSAADLANGFTVTYGAANGTEFDFEVSARNAALELLLSNDPALWLP
jgi:hypothetical protein